MARIFRNVLLCGWSLYRQIAAGFCSGRVESNSFIKNSEEGKREGERIQLWMAGVQKTLEPEIDI